MLDSTQNQENFIKQIQIHHGKHSESAEFDQKQGYQEENQDKGALDQKANHRESQMEITKQEAKHNSQNESEFVDSNEKEMQVDNEMQVDKGGEKSKPEQSKFTQDPSNIEDLKESDLENCTNVDPVLQESELGTDNASKWVDSNENMNDREHNIEKSVKNAGQVHSKLDINDEKNQIDQIDQIEGKIEQIDSKQVEVLQKEIEKLKMVLVQREQQLADKVIIFFLKLINLFMKVTLHFYFCIIILAFPIYLYYF